MRSPLRRRRPWPTAAPSPWADHPAGDEHGCPICRWTGAAFEGVFHSESALCPRCGSITRDRFLFWCLVRRTPAPPPGRRLRLLETSPRLGDDYRQAMSRWFDYTCSDYDERAHRATVRIDLQAIDRPDRDFDLIVTPHVLEHVPDTDAALREIHRVLRPGGRMYLQVPVLQGRTAPPSEPEFHGDHTPVFWRFGFDLTARLRDAGFTTTLLCTEEWATMVSTGATSWPGPTSGEFDVASMLHDAVAADLEVVADRTVAQRFGILPAYQHFVWECIAR